MTLVGTRPEIIKLSQVIAELDRQVRHVLVHSGQNYDYELNEIFFNELGIRKPDHFLNAVGAGVARTIGNVIAGLDQVLELEKPDAFLILGDTNSCLGVIAAKRRKIPIFHMEAGNRCFDQRVPEEINRKIVDHTSDINLTYTEHARRYLLTEGLRPETVIKTGSPMQEVLAAYRDRIAAAEVLDRLELQPGKYFVVSAHREENIDDGENFTSLLDSVNGIAEHYALPVIFSTHPRTRKKLEQTPGVAVHSLVRFMKPLGFPDYVRLQQEARCVVSDSGTITEESSILGFPAITIRQAHERPEGMDEGTLIMAGLGRESVLRAIKTIVAQHQQGARPTRIVADYEVDNVSLKVVRIILSYIEYVNRTVWFKR
jgi:UDP-N-acetylglucosamine 2-epimerase (non-hydrolysing)